MELSGYLKLKGQHQGDIQGSSIRKGRENLIELYSFGHCVEMPLQGDAGLPSGAAMHRPLKVAKEVDKASPRLYQALCQKESLPSAEFSWYRFNQQGREELYFRIQLEKALVVRIEPWTPSHFDEKHEQFRFMEWVDFVYEKITWSWGESGSVEYETDWFQNRVK